MEQAELERRYAAAVSDAGRRGCAATLDAFADACKATKAVFNCSLDKLFRAVGTGTEIFETYHDLERLRVRSESPGDADWQKLRPQAEVELLGTDQFKDMLFYGLLSITGDGLGTYGECTVVLKESMIAHRTSCFEENSGVFWRNSKTFPVGKRSDWNARYKLCISKLGARLTATTAVDEFPQLILKQGATGLDDEFIEVQVFGPITPRTIESVAIDSKSVRGRTALWKVVKHKLIAAGAAAFER